MQQRMEKPKGSSSWVSKTNDMEMGASDIVTIRSGWDQGKGLSLSCIHQWLREVEMELVNGQWTNTVKCAKSFIKLQCGDGTIGH